MSDAPKDLRKLCIHNVKETDTDEFIRSLCEKYGTVIHFNRPTGKNCRLAFPLYITEADAKNAKECIAKEGYSVDYANVGRAKSTSEEFRSQQNLADLDGSTEYAEPDSSEQGDRPYGICIKCGSRAYLNCGRCGDFYCSVDCQSSDWLKHKRNCFPMPKLVPSHSIACLNASRGNIAKSPEKLPETNGDNTDGQPNVVPSPRNDQNIEVKERVVSRHSDHGSVAENSIKTQIPVAHTNGESKKISPRQQLIESMANGQSPTVKSPAAPTAMGCMTSVTIPNDSNVFITHVKNYSHVYVRSEITNEEYVKLINDVENASKTARKLNNYPRRDDMVMAPFERDYYRACVIKNEEKSGTVKVGYIDFGNWQEVPFGLLRVLPQELCVPQRQAIMISLKNMKEDAENHEASVIKERLEALCNEGTLLRINGDKTEINAKDSVELVNVMSNISINNELNGMVQKRYHLTDLEHTVVEGPNLKIMAIEAEKISDNILTCLLQSSVNEFMAGDQKVQTFGDSVKNAPAYSPKVKELCVVKIKEPEGDVWYRCMYQQELVEEMAQVFCIDYGRINKVCANNIRAMTSELNHKISSFVCIIKDGNNIPMEKKKAISNNPADITAKEIAYEDEMHVITLDI